MKDRTRSLARTYQDLRSTRSAWTRTAGEALSLPVPIPTPMADDDKDYALHCDYRLWVFTQRVAGGTHGADDGADFASTLDHRTTSRHRLDASLFETPLGGGREQPQLIFGLDV
mmetsp:Transcript_8733/g.22288  ORF Transcript_8733/g.22288 Transcript_8733/m.22288 type:complete len:114 (+) Transcript_8733:107-448(+)|eukprot:CAMPEP_0197422238 /NCGR_PEP_ID=MMETSP1170-20131217/14391_1 /TAXON_ID=54406 /ORGANISM="Sarcinochrysis sp, Strain CCMP770" /LENGTH=113 /DNA_ID=CAMNT_0042949565 /DNA_START=82 /DNA_END=423 /DNA_ORIENTATION=+